MQSKTFCFNLFHKGYLKKNFGRFWPLMLIYTLLLVFVHPFVLYIDQRNGRFSGVAKADWLENCRNTFYNNIANMPDEIFIMIAAFVFILAMFGYLYYTRYAYSLHAFPLTRVQLFATNILTILLMLVLPQLLSALLTNLVILSVDTALSGMIWIRFLDLLVVDLFFTGFGTFIALFAGQYFSAVLFYVIWNFLYPAIVLLTGSLTSILVYGVDSPSLDLCSPLWPIGYLAGNTGYRQLYQETGTSLHFVGGKALAAFAVVSVGLIAAAYYVYKKRQLERAGDFITVGFAKPLFRWGATIVLACCAALFMYSMFSYDYLSCAGKTCRFLLWVIPFGICVFFAAEMFISKSFRVMNRKKWIECGGLLVVLTFVICFIGFDFVHVASYMPKRDQIASVSLNGDVTLSDQVDSGLIDDVVALHQDIIDHKEKVQRAESENNQAWLNIQYMLKNGRTVRRNYSIPCDEKQSDADLAEIMQKYEALRKQPVMMKYLVFGEDYQHAQIDTISIYNLHYDDTNNGVSYIDTGINLEDAADAVWKQKFYQAILDDIDAGAISSAESSENELAIDIQYYYRTSNGNHSTGYSEIYIGKESTHTLSVIKEMKDRIDSEN